MNDFTKKELEAIHWDLDRNENPWQCGESILNKLQFLIDNYRELENQCEHMQIDGSGIQLYFDKCKIWVGSK